MMNWVCLSWRDGFWVVAIEIDSVIDIVGMVRECVGVNCRELTRIT